METIDKVFYINMNKSTDRAEKFTSQCKVQNIPSEKIERYDAIDGTDHIFNEKELEMFKSASYVKNNHKRTKQIMGNSLSHYNLFCKMVQEGWEKIIIFQDDVVLRPNFIHYIDQLMPTVPSDAEIVYLGLHKYAYFGDFSEFDLDNCENDEILLNSTRSNVNDYINLFNDNENTCTLGYVLTKKGAIGLIEYCKINGFMYEADHQLNNYLMGKRINYISKYILCTGNENFKSTIWEKTTSVKVGVTIFFNSTADSIFNSGVQQNSLFLAELLLNIGYNVFLISNMIEASVDLKNILYDPRFVCITEKEVFSYNFDLILIVGYDFLTSEFISHFKTKKTKLVSYKCGNDYFLDCEAFCYKIDRSISHKQKCFDEIWSIPQMYELNYHYWKTLYRCPVIETPFVWSEKLVDKAELLYKPSGIAEKRIAILEPNISIMKCAIPPILICENAYRQNKNISKVFITNMLDIKRYKNVNNSALESLVQHFELHMDQKIFIEDRYRTVPMMKYSADIAVSHTFCNPLNYLYFDLAWMGYPIIHNAYMCKDVGYFYPDNNYEKGGEVLIDTILSHDNHCEDYLLRNRLYIDKYLPINKKLKYTYQKMIENILK